MAVALRLTGLQDALLIFVIAAPMIVVVISLIFRQVDTEA
jgi:hypothetical protein